MATVGLYYFVSYTVCPELVCVLISLTPCVRVSLCLCVLTLIECQRFFRVRVYHRLSDKYWADSYIMRKWMACKLVSLTLGVKGWSVLLCLLHRMQGLFCVLFISYTVWQGLVCVLVSLITYGKG